MRRVWSFENLTHLLIKAPIFFATGNPIADFSHSSVAHFSQYLSKIAFNTRWNFVALRVSDDKSKTAARDPQRFKGTSFRWFWILVEPLNTSSAAANLDDINIPS
jgi:hypothetical protein